MWLAESVSQWLWMFFACLVVVMTDLINSGIAAAVDRWGAEHHELIGRAKDLGSAAVFVSLLFFFVVWGMTLVDRFIYDFWPS